MKNSLFTLAFVFFFLGCNQKIEKNDIYKINGYWEIEKVILKDGDKKEYKVNETIDFFDLKENKGSKIIGFRQKVMPQFNGKFITNGDSESIIVSNSNGSYYVNYTTQFGKWKEEIIEIKDSTLVLKNKDNIKYQYKRFKPFSLK